MQHTCRGTWCECSTLAAVHTPRIPDPRLKLQQGAKQACRIIGAGSCQPHVAVSLALPLLQHSGHLACCPGAVPPTAPTLRGGWLFSELWIVAWSLLALSSLVRLLSYHQCSPTTGSNCTLRAQECYLRIWPASVLAFVLHWWPAYPWPAQPKGPVPFAVATHLVSPAPACCLPAPAEPSVELQRSQHTRHTSLVAGHISWAHSDCVPGAEALFLGRTCVVYLACAVAGFFVPVHPLHLTRDTNNAPSESSVAGWPAMWHACIRKASS